jgi:hypothetical protein
MWGKGLGQVFQNAMSNGGQVPPPPRAITKRRPWVYVLAAFGAGLACAGALLLLIVMLSPATAMSAGAVKAGGWLLFVGALVLGAGWIGTLGTGHGGFIAILASFAAPAGLAYFHVHVGNPYEQETTVAILGLGLGLFAGGHIVARGIHAGVRVVAAIATAFVICAFSAEAQHWHIEPHSLGQLYCVAFFALATTALALAVNLGFLAGSARSR